jgi:hypothetical protein
MWAVMGAWWAQEAAARARCGTLYYELKEGTVAA